MSQPQRLSAADMEILAFAHERWRRTGPQETAVLERFGMTLVNYHQRLNELLADPAAEAYDPELVHRLRRLRERRRQAWTSQPTTTAL